MSVATSRRVGDCTFADDVPTPTANNKTAITVNYATLDLARYYDLGDRDDVAEPTFA